MNMFARFNENPAMTLQDIKETKRYGRTDGCTDGRTDGQRENSIPPTNKVCGGYNEISCLICFFLKKRQNLKLSSVANYRWRFKA